MKTRTATVLSVAGVLAAGSAAALVNSQVLQSSAADSTALAAFASTSVPAPPAEVTVAPSTAAASTLVGFDLGPTGIVTFDSAGGQLALASVEPGPGWTHVATEQNAIGGLDVVLASSDTEVRFSALLADGEVVTSVGSRALGGGGAFDDHDDGHDDDDHDDDHDDDSDDDDHDDSDDHGRDDDD